MTFMTVCLRNDFPMCAVLPQRCVHRL